MDFFGIGPLEILLVLLVALVIFGPGRMTEVGRQLGKAVRMFKQVTFDVTAQVTKEFEEAKKDLQKSATIDESPPPPSESKNATEK